MLVYMYQYLLVLILVINYNIACYNAMLYNLYNNDISYNVNGRIIMFIISL